MFCLMYEACTILKNDTKLAEYLHVLELLIATNVPKALFFLILMLTLISSNSSSPC